MYPDDLKVPPDKKEAEVIPSSLGSPAATTTPPGSPMVPPPIRKLELDSSSTNENDSETVKNSEIVENMSDQKQEAATDQDVSQVGGASIRGASNEVNTSNGVSAAYSQAATKLKDDDVIWVKGKLKGVPNDENARFSMSELELARLLVNGLGIKPKDIKYVCTAEYKHLRIGFFKGVNTEQYLNSSAVKIRDDLRPDEIC